MSIGLLDVYNAITGERGITSGYVRLVIDMEKPGLLPPLSAPPLPLSSKPAKVMRKPKRAARKPRASASPEQMADLQKRLAKVPRASWPEVMSSSGLSATTLYTIVNGQKTTMGVKNFLILRKVLMSPRLKKYR